MTLTDSLKEKTKTKFRSQCSGELVEGYGMTECAGPVWIEGKTLGSELKLGENGELIVCGDQIALGYAENGKFHCFDGKLNSGDIFTQREGKLLFQSRAKDVIQQAGMKIFPGLLEEALARLDLFKEVIVFPYPIGQQAFPCFLFTSRQSMLNNEQENLISSWIRENLSPEWRPVFWKKVDQIPRTPSGKPDRTAAAYLATLF